VVEEEDIAAAAVAVVAAEAGDKGTVDEGN
jgi:hypothetical protein